MLGKLYLDSIYSFSWQAIDRLGDEITVVARGPNGVIEAIKLTGPAPTPWAIGVQWHPEMAARNDIQNRLFSAFIGECRLRRDSEQAGSN